MWNRPLEDEPLKMSLNVRARGTWAMALTLLLAAACITAPVIADANDGKASPTSQVSQKMFKQGGMRETLAGLDRLNLRAGREIKLPSGRTATVLRFIYAASDTKVFPFLILYEPKLADDLDNASKTTLRSIQADHAAICKAHGADLRELTAELFPNLVGDIFIVRFRDKWQEPAGKQKIVRHFGTVFDLTPKGCVLNDPA